jgi:Tfp pilus assembly protein PilV
MLKSKSVQAEQGFTMMEILVSVLITTTFVLLSMQALVMATMLRVQAQRTEQANSWLQEDIENAKIQALAIAPDNQKCYASTYANGYAADLQNTLNTNLPIDASSARTIFGTVYNMERTYITAGSAAPHKVLRINYQIRPWNGTNYTGDAIARDYIELIPDPALQCP